MFRTGTVKRIRSHQEPSIVKTYGNPRLLQVHWPGKRAGLATHKHQALTVSVAGCWNSTMRRVLLHTHQKCTVYIDGGMPHRPGIASEILTQRPDSAVGNKSMQDVLHQRSPPHDCYRPTTRVKTNTENSTERAGMDEQDVRRRYDGRSQKPLNGNF